MIITAWVLLIMFGLISVLTLWQVIWGSGISICHTILWVLSIIITAISAGVIWGGLAI
jgi:hypothetical protein